MNFELTYLLKGKKIKTTKNDENVEVVFVEDGNKNTVTLKALNDITVQEAYLGMGYIFKEDDALFCNGYQSCTDTREFGIHDKMNNLKQSPSLLTKMFSFKSYGDIAFYDYKKGVLHSWDVAYVRGDDNLFIGNDNFKWAGLIIEFYPDKNEINLVDDINNVVLKKGEEKVFFSFHKEHFKDLNDLEYFKQFKPRTTNKIVGYSSWYNHFDKINESLLLSNLNAVDAHFNLFQIDDGYEAAVGDWKLTNHEKFPNGLRSVVEKIHEKNVMAGIWIAPFVAQEGSNLLAYHPDWFKLGEDSKPIKCGSNWGGFYALDFYKSEVREYIKDCLLFYKNMGFDYFKLDFLYAVSLPLYEGKNRYEVACEAYRFLREVLGEDTLILGNSCNMAPAFEVFDYVRIGCSITLSWDDSWVMRKTHRERNSTKHSILDTLTRSIFNGKVFLNDPDVFLLRKDIELTFEQRYALAIINALFGSVLTTSDNLTQYDRLYPNYDKKATALLEQTIDLAKRATNVKQEKKGDLIEISYMLDEKVHKLNYDPENGTLVEI